MRNLELPQHVIYSIFLKLPVKTLRRFRRLSKEWKSIIDQDRTFHKHHYLQNKNNSNTPCHLFTEDRMQLFHYATINKNKSWSQYIPYRPPLPFCADDFYYYASSSCHGMMCNTYIHREGHMAIIVVWNPALRQCRQIPWPILYCGRSRDLCSSFVGMGYDHVTDDYKIVVHTHHRSAYAYRTHIMALKSNNVWRTIDDDSIPWGQVTSSIHPVSVDGDVYWFSSIDLDTDIKKKDGWISYNLPQDWRHLIIKFNVADERLTFLPTPTEEYISHFTRWCVKLGLYKGSLCYYYYYDFPIFELTEQQCARIWTLAQDKNGKATWNEVMDVPTLPFLLNYPDLYPCGFTISGDFIIRSRKAIIVYLVRERRFAEVMVDHHLNMELSIPYIVHLMQAESLIFPAYQ